jgi:hypothetical protein
MNAITVYTSQHWDMADSYGLIACQLARHLTALGVRVNAMSLGKTVMDSQPDDVRAVTSRPILPTFGGIAMGYPTNYHHHAPLHYGPRMALTMFESSKLPQDWIAPLNDMHAVIVPSEFCRTVFMDSGVTAPVHVVPLGVGDIYRYQERSTGRPLTFLAFFDRGERKGGMMAQQAFTRAFGDDMRYKLILKARAAKPGRALVLTNPNIEVIHQDMSEQELYELYCRCDVLINPHKGEGFGLLPREFAATGGFALTTGWSGTADAIEQWGYALPYTLETAHCRHLGMDKAITARQGAGGAATVQLAHVCRARTEHLSGGASWLQPPNANACGLEHFELDSFLSVFNSTMAIDAKRNEV